MKLSGDMKAFEERLGHVFSRPELLVRALTHGSMSSANVKARKASSRLSGTGRTYFDCLSMKNAYVWKMEPIPESCRRLTIRP